ncbi:FCD domain-containing protein [Octadecabacter ascidiaceicola]|uniref:HTH-type transcriptional regulator LutR n=1 Tax=Octadecabacter ascidiaceicola TaxID=1655543 RepID=A0A238KAJ9_9RHOB|nr:FCD domain-containing protein [Octadecabacter ascidiaceicola]SMX39547.1 HTH-type transcriptional regulator LutR [Octadecabacter ascidiaceicola]
MKPQKLYQQVEQALSEEIAEGIHKPGEALPPERDLMERFGVGRPSIREALFSLSKRGLIELGSGRRPRVVEPNFDIVLGEIDVLARLALRKEDNLFHLMELRRILECALVRKLALEATPEQISELKERLDENVAALGDLQRFWRTDSEFHKTIARMSGNPLLPTIVEAILKWLIDNRKVTLAMPGSAERAMKHHQTIYNAISARQPDAADQAMATHLISVEERIRASFSVGA